jgi:uncharacterized lipoprotein YbaY
MVIIRNKFYLKPSSSLSVALARMDARDMEHRITVLSKKITTLETRSTPEFIVEDAIRT